VALTTWFATVQLFAIGVVFLLAARANRERAGSQRAGLFLAGLVFAFLSADEGGGIHERITLIMEERGLDTLLFPGNHGGWIAVYVVAGSIFVLAAGAGETPAQLVFSVDKTPDRRHGPSHEPAASQADRGARRGRTTAARAGTERASGSWTPDSSTAPSNRRVFAERG